MRGLPIEMEQGPVSGGLMGGSIGNIQQLKSFGDVYNIFFFFIAYYYCNLHHDGESLSATGI